MPRVAIITNVLPHYRLGFYQRLAEAGLDYTVFCQDHLPGFNLRLVHNQLENVHLVRSLGSERRVVWQFLPVLRLLAYDVLVFYGNPRVLSTVVWATLFKALGIAVEDLAAAQAVLQKASAGGKGSFVEIGGGHFGSG